ncbi:Bis(5'-nucleosyl)-tetraphosphatase PrpE [asymmetrical] [compost metagenome]
MEMKFRSNEIIVLAGPNSTGKTTFAKTRFATHGGVLSSDDFRMMISDMNWVFTDQTVKNNDKDQGRFDKVDKAEFKQLSEEAFNMLRQTLNTRAKLNRLTVIDATNINMDDIKSYSAIARKNNVPISIVFFNLPIEKTLEFNESNINNNSDKKIKNQYRVMKDMIKNKRKLNDVGISSIYEITTSNFNEIKIKIEEQKLYITIGNGLDVMGDGHGLLESRINLIEKAGYIKDEAGIYRHPEGRKLVYLNDETGKASQPLENVEYGQYPSIAMAVMMMKHVKANAAYAVDSNHNYKLWRYLEGRNVKMLHGDEIVVEEFTKFEEEYGKEKTEELKQELRIFLKSLPSHLVVLDRCIQRAVIVHAGIEDDMIGKDSMGVRDFCRFGPTNGEKEDGTPNRLDWTQNHKNGMLIIWGHDPQIIPSVKKDTINIDQGGFCGHYLTMLRYPEMEIVQEKVDKSYVKDDENPIMKKMANRFDAPEIEKYLSDFEVTTKHGKVDVWHQYAQEAIENISTRTVPIEELIYVAPTMSPTPKTSKLDEYLEHPNEAFEYYSNKGTKKVIVQKKHMGSRALVTLFKNKSIGKVYFGKETLGTIASRNNIRFFDSEQETKIVEQLVFDLKDYFEEQNTTMIVMDCEILPWNLKASGLIKNQYGLTATSAVYSRQEHLKTLHQFHQNRDIDVALEIDKATEDVNNALAFQKAFSNYCWDTEGLTGVQIAPFHILAFSEKSNFDMNHEWHMEQSIRMAKLSSLVISTPYMIINLDNENEIKEATDWWIENTNEGHEGFVVKPIDFIAKDEFGNLIQPAIKVRGKEYLRIIYGMDYLEPYNLIRLKKRSAGKKMEHAIKQFMLSIESVERFVAKEQVDRIHECIVASLSIDSDYVDPRL